MVNINRLYKAMNDVDPEGKYRWYVKADIDEVMIEALGNQDGVAYQATAMIFAHANRYDERFISVMEKMEAITKALDTSSDKKVDEETI